MEWNLVNRPEAVVVELQSSPVNKQNPEYFADLHRAFDRLDSEFPGKPVVLTGKGSIFSVGLDLEHCVPMFARRDVHEVAAWFMAYRQTMMRVFASPRLTIAALNGHTFAGGLVLALCCDFRIAAAGSAKFALNEVPIGIPMPSAYTEILRYRLGNRIANDAILLGRTCSVERAREIGYVSEIVAPEKLVDTAVAMAGEIVEACWPAYVQAKSALLHPVLAAIDSYSAEIDQDTLRVMTSPASLGILEATLSRLKTKR